MSFGKCKLKKGDEVIFLSGRSKGETGKVDQIDYKAKQLWVAGKNLAKRHQKPNFQNPDGGIIEISVPVDISNVALVDPKTNKPTRVGYRIEDGRKIRFAKKSGTVLS